MVTYDDICKTKLLEILTERSIVTGNFQLASGGTSNYYIDCRKTSMCSVGAFVIGELIFHRTCDRSIASIGGMAVGAVPITVATLLAYNDRRMDINGFWVRVEPKTHGRKLDIEGNVYPGQRVAIVEDVMTKGNSALKAADALVKHGCEVVTIIALVDRLQGARELLKEKLPAVDYQSVFTIRDFDIEP